MSEEATSEVEQPATLMMAAGAILAVFYGVYALWSGFGAVMGCLGTGVSGLAAMSDDGAIFGLIWSLFSLMLSSLSVLIYAALAGAGGYVAMTASSFKELLELERVQRAVLLLGIIPVVGILTNGVISIAQFSCCGLMFGLFPQLIVGGLAGAAAYMGHQALQSEGVKEAFHE